MVQTDIQANPCGGSNSRRLQRLRMALSREYSIEALHILRRVGPCSRLRVGMVDSPDHQLRDSIHRFGINHPLLPCECRRELRRWVVPQKLNLSEGLCHEVATRGVFVVGFGDFVQRVR